MPKITGPSIAEHVAAQEQAIFAAATSLFARDGVNNVGIGAIAESVGLARSSLYRYFPTKASIVHRWFDNAMGPLIDRSEEIARSADPADQRLIDWVDLQLDFLADADNQAMIRASLETDDIPDEQRRAVNRRHHDLYGTLEQIIDRPDVDEGVTRSRVLLIAGVLRSIADLLRAGIPEEVARQEVMRATTLIAGGWANSDGR